MMKKKLTGEEAMVIAKRLNIISYLDMVRLIDSLHIESNKELNICVLTSDRRSAENIFKSLTDINIHLGYDNTLKAIVQFGTSAYEVITEYGELSVDESQFCEIIAHNNTDCKVVSENEALKNLRVTFIYTPEYESIDEDTWRCILLEADKAIMVINAHRILPQTEQSFVKRMLLPVYSQSRLLFGMGNAQYMKSEEWLEGVERIHRKVGKDYIVFPVFTDDIPKEIRTEYTGSEVTLESILQLSSKTSIEVRKLHIEDLDNYKSSIIEKALLKLRHKMEGYLLSGSEVITASERNIEKLTLSRQHIEKYIELFLQTPLIYRYREDVEKFSSLLTDSLKEDIWQSSDIKQDTKALPRYLSFVWDQFTEEQNLEISRLFEKETSTIVDMMNLDVKKIARDMDNIELSTDLKKFIEGAFTVHTFFARKTTSGNGLTEAMTIGGLITTLISPPLGVGVMLGSELLKVFGKEKFDKEYKIELQNKIGSIIDGNMKELISQAEVNFKKVADVYRNEILKYYDEKIDGIKEVFKKEKSIVEDANKTIAYIDSLI